MHFPNSDPQDNPEALWTLQKELLATAESILGLRDRSKKIYQPRFSDDGPNIRNTPNLDGAFAELSRDAKFNWPEVVFELAHETIHLLDPIAGSTNNLEEGVAVAFSIYVQPCYGICIRPASQSYIQALQLADMLPGSILRAGRRVRNRVGALSNVTAQELEEVKEAMFPGRVLAEQFW